MEGKEDTAQLRVLSSRRVTRRLDYKSSMGFLSSSGGGRNNWKQEIYQHKRQTNEIDIQSGGIFSYLSYSAFTKLLQHPYSPPTIGEDSRYSKIQHK